MTPIELNSTGGEGARSGALPVPPIDERAAELLERRASADAVLYRRAAGRRLGGAEAARRLAVDSFAAQRNRFAELASPAGDLTPAGQASYRRPLHRAGEQVEAACRRLTTSAASASL